MLYTYGSIKERAIVRFLEALEKDQMHNLLKGNQSKPNPDENIHVLIRALTGVIGVLTLFLFLINMCAINLV